MLFLKKKWAFNFVQIKLHFQLMLKKTLNLVWSHKTFFCHNKLERLLVKQSADLHLILLFVVMQKMAQHSA